MSNKYNDIEVIINNKRYTISGAESEEYLHRIASYINNKYAQMRNKDAYKFLDAELKNIMLQINIADDYYKTLDKLDELKKESESKSNEIYDMRHELITTKTMLDAAYKEIEELKNKLNEAQKKIVRLETELDDLNKRSR